MLNYIWVGLLIIGIIVGIINGKIDVIGTALLDSANDAVTFCIGLLGVVTLWCGLMQIFQDAGGINFIARLIRPLIRLLFPETRYNKEAEKHIITNLTANFLGLGNGATPSGIAAVQELEKNNTSKTALKSTCLFLVINSAAIQLVPTTIIALRSAQGAKNPADILIPTWLTSIFSLIVGVLVFYILSSRRRK